MAAFWLEPKSIIEVWGPSLKGTRPTSVEEESRIESILASAWSLTRKNCMNCVYLTYCAELTEKRERYGVKLHMCWWDSRVGAACLCWAGDKTKPKLFNFSSYETTDGGYIALFNSHGVYTVNIQLWIGSCPLLSYQRSEDELVNRRGIAWLKKRVLHICAGWSYKMSTNI